MNNDKDTAKDGPNTPNNVRLPRETQLKKAQYQAMLLEVQQMYWIHMTTARIIFKSDIIAMNTLDLQETRWDSIFSWTSQAKEFYHNVLHTDEFLKKMIAYGITGEELEQGLLKLKELEGDKYWKKQCNEEDAPGKSRPVNLVEKIRELAAAAEKASRRTFQEELKHRLEKFFAKAMEKAIEKKKKQMQRKLEKNRPMDKTGDKVGDKDGLLK